jgi:hypothetical protein
MEKQQRKSTKKDSLKRAIGKVVDMYLDDEEEHYEGMRDGHEPTRKHIVHALRRLAKEL